MYQQNHKHLSIILTIVSFMFIFLVSAVHAADVTLTWNKPDDSRVIGYNIYYGISGTDFTSTPVQTVNSPDQTSCLILNLEEGQAYDFAAKSLDSEGNESELSEIINYLVPVTASDIDGDGYTATDGDCNDNDVSIHPGAIEICGDGIDQDCSGSDLICTPDPNDVDNDGDGYTENEGDFNDSDATVSPSAIEICGDGIDQDCDGSDLVCVSIEGVTLSWTKPGDDRVIGYHVYCGKSGTDFQAAPYVTINSVDTTSYAFSGLEEGFEYSFAVTSFDADGNESAFSETITYFVGSVSNDNDIDNDVDGYTENEGDCNDSDPLIHPNAAEICGDGIDQDCNGSDLTCPEDIDNDSDGYTENQGDCNDSDSSINPGAAEICGDGIDQDCNGSDLTCPEDIDNDGDSYTENQGDCNDNDSSIHPNAAEICGDGIDQDCNGSDLTCPEDIDNDGDGYTENEGDCNDSDASIHPGAMEICGDGIDQDCNGSDLVCIEDPDSQTLVFGDTLDADYPGTIQDTFINLNTEVNYASEQLNTYTWPENMAANAVLIQFDLSQLPAGAQIQSATLSLYQTAAGGDAAYDVGVHKVINNNPDLYQANGYTCDGITGWTANSLCYNNIPLAQADIAQAGNVNSLDLDLGNKEWDVTGMVQDWVNDANLNYGLMLNSDSVAASNSYRNFASSEAIDATQRPRLEVTFTSNSIEIDPQDIDDDGDSYTENEGDCNDTDATIFPGAIEICGDGIDQDCNGSDLVCAEDIDNDSDGYTENEGDCNDSDASIHPNAVEICGDGIDQDCNGSDLVCPEDIDNDGDGYTENEGDCNDSDALIHPGAAEICGDGIDQDCNGTDLVCPEDIDNDGDGYTENEGDYNDNDFSIHPNAAEICGDGIDQDCNGSDLTCPEDIDNDSDGYTENQGDCNDNDSSIHPNAAEICGDGIDQDCNGNDLTCPEDIDNDADGYTENEGDCNDSDASIHPGAAEICGDGIDQDCDGTDLVCPEDIDNDGDGYTENEGDYNDSDSSINPGAAEICGDGIDQDCNGSDLVCAEDIDNDSDGYTENEGDSNDSDASIYPGAIEICGDGIDQDCDGIDQICPEDIDADEDGYTENEGDFNDNDATIYPGAIEICGDGIDQDCDGTDLVCPEDIDNDGDGYTENEGDYNDSEASVYPGAIEICGDGIDQDCDGNDLECIPEEDTLDIAMETGEVEIDQEWLFVAFNNTFTNPVVVAKPASLNDDDPAVVRVRNVTSTGFEVRIQEWDYLDGIHDFETVSYMVMEKGRHVLPNGINVEAGTFEENRWGKVSFDQTFNQIPVVISGVMTENELDAVTGRAYKISLDGFTFFLQEQESTMREHLLNETISYIAWEPSSGTVNGMNYIVDSTFNEVTQNLYNVPFYPSFNSTPVCVADMQTKDGGDTANVRWQSKNADGIEVQIDEEQSKDSEVSHTTEVVGYMAFGTSAQ